RSREQILAEHRLEADKLADRINEHLASSRGITVDQLRAEIADAEAAAISADAVGTDDESPVVVLPGFVVPAARPSVRERSASGGGAISQACTSAASPYP